MEDVKVQKSEVNDSKSRTSKVTLEQANTALTIVIKIIVIGVLLASFNAGKSVYQQYAHYGPSCTEKASSFQYWIDKAGKEKGKIVSVHQSRLQTENGTTQCFGQFQTESGQYKDWSGSISELTNKEVIGWARVSN
ncbi:MULTISPECIES: hypothetical protein [Vibrio]|uniref:hypothetical protein n=1 Tax=Vibrio TaxID=662 RepID=UPI001CDCE5A2|nr:MULTISPECIES: hypothetical protein [Vibrio]MCA2422753.1 hypothetical protein [Vibrio alginolyticus]MCA2447402.1 hypothetical protein [Vibrio alginolyticus]MDW2067534.1 hypothetical protein [Vibrio sp. 1579]MDW2161501.1 hypothetical protein [Vibrio sp. 1942]MDW2183390.1 hypothetical protein [Vibrio sp. 1762]